MNDPRTLKDELNDELEALIASHRERAARLLESQRNRVQRFDMSLNKEFDEFVAQASAIANRPAPTAVNEPVHHPGPSFDSFWEQLEERLESLHIASSVEEHSITHEYEELPPIQQAPQPDPDTAYEIESLERRVESLQQQLRGANAENTELQNQVEDLRASLGDEPIEPSGLDWEAEKRRVLAALEADDAGTPVTDQDRDNLQNTIRISDRIIAEKDREIAELNRLLEQQSGNIGEVAIGAAAIGAALDNDELVQQERERLVVLQEEWTEKLRKAEVEISVERATFAREKAAFASEKQKIMRLLEKHNLSLDDIDDEPEVEVRRGRWREELGITSDDD